MSSLKFLALCAAAASVFSGFVAENASAFTETQITTDASGVRPNAVYSPELLYQDIGGVPTLVMYFGGWYRTNPNFLPNDSIYRAICSSPTSCGSIQKVIDPVAAGLGSAALLNDPTIVEVHNGGADYYIMYMTGVPGNTPGAGYTAGNNHIYYSTSYANDGVNWSTPQLLLNNAWLPSATVAPNGHVILTFNSNGNDPSMPFLAQADLTASGVNPQPYYAVNSGSNLYSNVQILYRPSISLYQILAQNFYNTNQIDYLYSSDGYNWTLGASNVDSGITPAQHPDTACYAYYGKDAGSYQINIFLKPWC